MEKQQGNMLNALENTRRFLSDHAEKLGTVITPAVRQKLDDVIAELSSTATAQDQYTRDRRGAFAVQEASRTALVREHMGPIAKIAKLELPHVPEMMKLSLPDKRLSVQQLGAHADGMAEAARPHASVFINAGRKPDFVERLGIAADRMRAAAIDGAQGRVRITTATSGLRQKLSRARKVVHVLDAFVKEAAGSDKALMDGWKIAQRVVKSGGGSRSAAPVGSIPAATTPAPAISAAAA